MGLLEVDTSMIFYTLFARKSSPLQNLHTANLNFESKDVRLINVYISGAARISVREHFRGWASKEVGFLKIFKIFVKKIAKRYYIILIFKHLKPCVNFSRVWTKNANNYVKIEKILKIFVEDSKEKLNFQIIL